MKRDVMVANLTVNRSVFNFNKGREVTPLA